MTANRIANSSATLHLHFRTLDVEVDGPSLFDALFASSPHAVWLDSPCASFSILCDGSGPFARTLFLDADAPDPRHNAFYRAQELLDYYRVEIPADLPCDFALGLVGAFGYELKEHAAKYESTKRADAKDRVEENESRDEGLSADLHTAKPESVAARDPLPDLALIYTDRAVVIDHVNHQTHVLYLLPCGADSSAAHPEARAQEKWVRIAIETIQNPLDSPDCCTSSSPSELTYPAFTLDQAKNEYLTSIERCLDYIAAGDSYEVCLTNTAQGPNLNELGFTPRSAYQSLRRTSPVPYGAYLQFTPDMDEASVKAAGRPSRKGKYAPFHILSASPEQFLKITGGHVSAQPIKGTRPRGTSEGEDTAWRRELQANPKDRAENLMIVDLLRNDLGRVCTVGSVQVPRIFSVETYSHVHQLVSTIEGHLAPGMTPLDCVAACFPGGSMTGAPKIRTMEIIEELERRPRGFYSGAVGWISPNGCADLSIVIRTLVCTPSATTFGVGGAIVADSDPEGEFEETMVKARALLEALGVGINELAPR